MSDENNPVQTPPNSFIAFSKKKKNKTILSRQVEQNHRFQLFLFLHSFRSSSRFIQIKILEVDED